ncbi:DUF21 domain-containing protein [Capsicum annuum]|uniref:DUF21 domain-containing protein n=1 Tax=Capsicum annuum TaxID=4072 RepID=A0A2G2ZMR3_CAPAN|nr:DUF21 domain-containing protein [Capsicum annuum]
MFGSYGFEGDMDSKEWFYSLATCGRPLNDTVKHADNIFCLAVSKILPVVKNQHLLLCTLLIGNSLAIESLPIFLDKLVPSWSAILVSVTLILMFGEIIPQVICTHYGLTIGATVAPLVQLLLWLFFLIAYPISKAEKGGDLTHDETTIITGALESMEKTAKDAMTPISKAFSLDLDGTLNLWIEIGYVRMRYGALLWDYGKRKLEVDSVLQGYLDVYLLPSRISLSGFVIRSFMLSGTIHDLVLLTGRISPWYICSQDCLEIQ